MQYKNHVAQSEVAASLAHEINNPLESVLSLLYMVEEEATLTQRGRECLTMAEEEIQRLSQIAQTALYRYRDPAARKVTDVPQLLNSVLGLYSARLKAGSISLHKRYRVASEVSLYPGELRQVVSNLLLNAADAMPQGGHLHARVLEGREWSGENRRGMRITIADDGCGIEKEDLELIFKPFFSKKGNGGSGLGLAVVRDVVKKHGGWLKVRSSTRQGRSGTAFVLFLPDVGR